MADAKIRGVTVQLGADTTGIQKGLADVNKEIKSTQSQLRDVEKLLKLDPTNTELLAQKQKLLADAIKESSTKVETLKKAEEELKNAGVDKNSEQFMALQREIISAQNDEKKFQQQSDELAGSLSDTGKSAKEAEKGVKGAGDESAKSESKFGLLKGTVAAVGAAFVAAGAAIVEAAKKIAKALIDASTSGAEYADNLLTQSTVTGISTDKLQEYQYASELVDVSVETLTGSMRKNITAMKNAANGSKTYAEAYDKLGISVVNADGSLRDSEEVYWELIEALGTVENETERDALAMTLLGKSAQDLNPLINAGADTMKKLGEEARNTGYVLGEEALAQYGAFDDAFQRLNNGATAAKNAIGTILLPVLTSLATDGTDLLADFTNAINETNGDINQIGSVVDEMLPKVISKIEEYLPLLLSLIESILGSLAGAIINNLPLILDAAGSIMLELIKGLIQAIPQVIDSAVDIIMALLTGIISMLPDIITAGIEIIIKLAEGLTEAIPDLIPAVVQAVMAILLALTDHLPELMQAGWDLTIALLEGLIKAIPELVKAIPQLIKNLVDAFKWELGKMRDIGKQIIEGLWSGIQSSWQWLKDKFTGLIDGLVGGVKDLLGIHSPSKVFASIGGYMAEGLGEGWKEKIGRVTSSITGSLGGWNINGSQTVAQTVALDASSLQAISTPASTNVSISFGGNLAQLGRVLQPTVLAETRRLGGSLVT